MIGKAEDANITVKPHHAGSHHSCGAYLLALAFFVSAFLLLSAPKLQATELSCPIENRISVDFEIGTGWDLCWESKRRENIVLSEIHFRSSVDSAMQVISTLRLAQLHVTYDDSNITYNDVTQFGLGGGYVSTLIDADCPGGELIDISGRPGLCKVVSRDDDAYRTSAESREAESLTLFSISQVGAYSYLVTWEILDDGSIAPSIGAAGALQRSSDLAHSPFGRELEGIPGKSWLSHTHNYYWRIDFDIGDNANDDVVNEVSYPLDEHGRRSRHVLPLLKESARTIDPETMRGWTITNGSGNTALAPGYLIEPVNYGHKLVRAITEPYTEFDFFVTRQSDCERFISENAKFHPDCKENILQFINDESLVNQDIVVWHRISFHHVPRNEDRQNMHSHWDGFLMQARNLSVKTPGHSGTVDNAPPESLVLSDQQHAIGEKVTIKLSSSDPDGDPLSFAATGLPEGFSINDSGVITGISMQGGLHIVKVTVSDLTHTSSVSFNWQIGPGSPAAGGAGAVVWSVLWLLSLTPAGYGGSRRSRE